MWRLIKIAQHSYLMNCLIGDDNAVTFILYNHKESWCETLTLEELKRKAKLLNRRYDFNEENVRETLMGSGGDLELATLEQQDVGRGMKFSLKLKYRVKNCPFHYELLLKKQTLQEFQCTFMQPLCTALLGYHEQIDVLTDCLKKKDAEILQYRKEGAILNRKTLATKLFDFEDFSKKYEQSNKIAADFSELSKFLLSAAPPMERRTPTKNKIKEQESPDKKENNLKKPHITSMSPGQRKRKIQELKQKHLERNMKTRKQNIEYENSQSQETYSGSSQSTECDFEQKKQELKSSSTLPQKKSKDIKPITDTKPKLQQKDENSKSSSVSPQKSLDKKQTDDTTQKAPEQKDQNSKLSKTSLTRDMKNEQDPENTRATTPISLSTSSTQVKAKMSPKCSAPQDDNEQNKSIGILSDTDSEDIILTPRKRIGSRNAKMSTPKLETTTESQSESDDIIISKSIQEKSSEKIDSKTPDCGKETRNQFRQKAMRCLAFNDVVEISTDSDNDQTTSQLRRYPRRRNTTSTPTKTKLRVTRSSPQSPGGDASNSLNKQRRSSVGMSSADFKILQDSPKHKTMATTPKAFVVGEISSQLSAIRKELESLEAMRLADLKQRACKI